MSKIYTGIDIGTYHVKVVIAQPGENPDLPMRILGTGTAISKGMRHGYIIDGNETTLSIREALARASSAAKTRIRSARVGIGGVGLDEIRSTGEVTLTPSGGIVTEREVERVLRESEKRATPKLANRTVLHTIPLEYRIDGVKVLGRPNDMQGSKLVVDTLLITALAQHQEGIIESVERCNIEVEGVMASPLAASLVTLTKAQKEAGVVLANIGAETLSIVVFDNNIPISIKVLPVGSSNITNVLALSFQVPLSEAEQMKRGAVTGSTIASARVQSVITGQLKDIFSLVNAHLKSIGRQRLLPAGIVITGGGSGLVNAQEIARSVLRLPSQLAQIGYLPRASSVDATWAVAYGLTRWAYAEDLSEQATVSDILKSALETIRRTLNALLP